MSRELYRGCEVARCGLTCDAVKYGETHSVTRGFMKEVEDHNFVWPGCILLKPLCVHLCYSSKRLWHEIVERLCRKVVANAHFSRRIEHNGYISPFFVLQWVCNM
jgi:hypothetical protein